MRITICVQPACWLSNIFAELRVFAPLRNNVTLFPRSSMRGFIFTTYTQELPAFISGKRNYCVIQQQLACWETFFPGFTYILFYRFMLFEIRCWKRTRTRCNYRRMVGWSKRRLQGERYSDIEIFICIPYANCFFLLLSRSRRLFLLTSMTYETQNYICNIYNFPLSTHQIFMPDSLKDMKSAKFLSQ